MDINCLGTAQTTLEDNSFRIDRTSEDNSFLILFTVLELADIHSSSRGAIGFPNVLKGYKFLKAEQESLDEVVNLSKFGKLESQSQPNIMTLFGAIANKENTAREADIKNGVADASAVFLNSAEETNISYNIELSMGER